MIAASHRQLLAVFIVAAGVCVGGYELFTAPARERLFRARQQADELRMRLREVDRTLQAGQAVRKNAGDYRSAAEILHRLTATGHDEAGLFARVESLAASHSVIVERITPSRTRATGAVARSDGQEAGDSAVGMELTVHSTYADLVGFVRGLQHGFGACRIESIAVAPDPAGSAETVTASIRLTTFAIAVADLPAMPSPPGDQP